MKKIISLLVVILMFIIVLVGCEEEKVQDNSSFAEKNSISNPNNEIEWEEEPRKNNPSSESFIFFGNSLLGSVNDGEFYSAVNYENKLKTGKWKYGDILSQNRYTAYSYGGEMQDDLILACEISEEFMKDNPKDDCLFPADFKEYATWNSGEQFYQFDLPVKGLSQELYDFESNFEDKYIISYYGESFRTNSNYDLNFAILNEDFESGEEEDDYPPVRIPDNIYKYVKDKATKNGLDKDASIVCYNAYSDDLNNDGVVDGFYFIASSDVYAEDDEVAEELAKKYGSMYILLLDLGNDDYNIVDEFYLKAGMTAKDINKDATEEYVIRNIPYCSNVVVADINNDEIYEISEIVSLPTIEHKYIYTLENDEPKLVLYNYYTYRDMQ